jgi:hypothetical protein
MQSHQASMHGLCHPSGTLFSGPTIERAIIGMHRRTRTTVAFSAFRRDWAPALILTAVRRKEVRIGSLGVGHCGPGRPRHPRGGGVKLRPQAAHRAPARAIRSRVRASDSPVGIHNRLSVREPISRIGIVAPSLRFRMRFGRQLLHLPSDLPLSSPESRSPGTPHARCRPESLHRHGT